MNIDVIIATYNRADYLEKALKSVLDAGREPGFDYSITVVDNNSNDSTRDVVKELAEHSGGRLRYLFEPRQGKSFALNTGIANTTAEIIAFTDDDQLVDDQWLCAIHRVFTDGYDYATGPVYGDWEIPPPRWYDDRLRGPVSLFDGGDQRILHDHDDDTATHHGFSGGNGAVLRRVIEKTGVFNTDLGGFGETLGLCEDSEFYLRLRAAKFRGVYEPRMKVFHRIPAARLTRNYFRKWYRSYGASMAMMNRLHSLEAPQIFGMPRFLIRKTLESFPRWFASMLKGDLPGAFEQELNLWFFTGYWKK
ncbi:MAG: glycosyltransferase family 2 protein [Acidobacteria bacterium]|nr:glycosyltransferase family 2 protein [Acidobacteriota bacterium]